jgi:hypothetical protein
MRARTVAEEDGVHGSKDGAGEGVLVKGRALCRRLGGGDAAVVGGVVLPGHGEGGRDALVEMHVRCRGATTSKLPPGARLKTAVTGNENFFTNSARRVPVFLHQTKPICDWYYKEQ